MKEKNKELRWMFLLLAILLINGASHTLFLGVWAQENCIRDHFHLSNVTLPLQSNGRYWNFSTGVSLVYGTDHFGSPAKLVLNTPYNLGRVELTSLPTKFAPLSLCYDSVNGSMLIPTGASYWRLGLRDNTHLSNYRGQATSLVLHNWLGSPHEKGCITTIFDPIRFYDPAQMVPSEKNPAYFYFVDTFCGHLYSVTGPSINPPGVVIPLVGGGSQSSGFGAKVRLLSPSALALQKGIAFILSGTAPLFYKVILSTTTVTSFGTYSSDFSGFRSGYLREGANWWIPLNARWIIPGHVLLFNTFNVPHTSSVPSLLALNLDTLFISAIVNHSNQVCATDDWRHGGGENLDEDLERQEFFLGCNRHFNKITF